MAPVASPGEGGTLTLGLYQAFTSFDPWSQSGTGGDSLSMQLQWDQLASYDAQGNVQMRLADSITGSADAKTWTIKLKPNLTWSDGSPLTADDVIFSWKLGSNPNQSYNSSLWTNVVGMTAWQKGPDFSKDFTGITSPDPQTIVFQLINPNAAFESVLLNFRNFILPKAALLKASPNIYNLSQKDMWALPFWQAPTVGEGPYLWAQTQTGQFMSYNPNPHWREGSLEFTSVILKAESSQAVAAADLQSGAVDIAVVTLNDIPGLTSAGFQTGTALAPFPVQTDLNNSPASRMSDVRVRQAFLYGCDRQGFVDTYLQGKGQAPVSYFFPSWVDKTGLNTYSFDLQKAKSLLDAAKFDYSKPLVWMSWNAAAPDRQAFIQDCQSKMKSIGVKIQLINGLDVTNALGAAGQWDLQTYGGYPIQDPDQVRQFTACSAIGTQPGKDSATFPNGHLYKNGGANYTNYCNPAFDALMNQASTLTDQSQRATLYEQAQTIFVNDVPIMVGYRNATVYAWNTKVTGIALYGDPSALDYGIDNWRKAP
ncbi:MAG TPA: peptide ABC transporter substrate-binding protein [Candidatus Saccharimonadales bacterium]|nr:peptide ABC transporter substrate-binding protein [Candidatus Saccharimonadales bacterium]